ncbi:class I SAM-dependent methyltransferase [Streptomyces sp. NPDC052309]|uniref:Class I SAM-dependent methyltransferase n=1 Tax=Streptomyces griseicoloratus TaxID=2752516 RepID=A0A926L6B4_9ACTN|nr:class I SAM-dependent methyltransferase [Streptomyces griseicoloratus]MBD0423407.1 class I SAM-dependent methyltransferase [Streptomyces griseicoloratus]
MRRPLTTALHGLLRLAPAHRHAHREPGGMGMSSVWYDRLSGRLLGGLYRRAAAETASLPRGGTVLDIGTGPGHLLLAAARRRPDLRLHGLDIAPSMVDRARHKAAAQGLDDRVTVHLGDAAHLPLEDRTMDLVVTTLSMHHWADVPGAVGEVARVLRPGGRFVVYDFRSVADVRPTGAVATDPRFAGAVVEHDPVRAFAWLPFRPFARLAVRLPAD